MNLRQLFDSPSKWTKGAPARNEFGVLVFHDSPNAVCWCLAGGLNKCFVGRANDLAFIALRQAARELFPQRQTETSDLMVVAQINDHPDTTFEDVIAIINKTEELYASYPTVQRCLEVDQRARC